MARLFISHSSRDNVAALAVQDWLVASGWARDDVFIDLHHIGAGERWRETLRKANASCEAIVFLASPDSIGSIECQKELELAEALGKEIIPVILRDLTKDDPRLARYSERQFADLSVEPRERMEPVAHDGQLHHLDFNLKALHAISARLSNLGVAPESFLWPPKGASDPAPYPGLAAFSEGDAGIFFGRDADIMSALTEIRLVRRRRAPRLIVIEAASGAGKSSFLRAGLWPRLARDPDFAPLAILRPAQGILSGPDGLGRRVAPFFAHHGQPKTPGDIYAPLKSAGLEVGAEALGALLVETIELASETRRATSPDARPPAPILAIDQGEELFAAENEEESERFLAMLIAILKEPPKDLDPYVLITIRADSVQSLLARVAELGLETPKPLYLPPMSMAAYRDVVLGPARAYSEAVKRLTVEPALADALVDEARGADALPLLAFTLSRLFADYGSGGELTREQYQVMGGVAGSIRRALDDARLRAGAAGTTGNLRRLLLPQLATWDPNADQQRGAAKRLVAPIARVLAGDNCDLSPLANALVEARLLTRQSGTLEVAHEALLRQAPICDWLEEDREFLVWRDRVARERTSFEGNHRGLLAGRELQIAMDWLRIRPEIDIADSDRDFVILSHAEDSQRRNKENEREALRQAAELEMAQAREQAAQQKALAARRTTAALIVLLMLASVAGIAGFYAYMQQAGRLRASAEAIEQREVATKQTAIAEDERSRASEALREAQVNQARFMMQRAREAMTKRDYISSTLHMLAVLPDPDNPEARPIVDGTTAILYDSVRKTPRKTVLRGHTGAVRSVSFSSNAMHVVTASDDATARIWDVESGKVMRIFEGHKEAVLSAVFSPDSKTILTASHDHTARLWNAETGKEIAELSGHGNAVWSAFFDPDGARIVTASTDHTARIWDGKTGRAIGVLEGHTAEVVGATFSADGKNVLTASFDATARIWDVESRTPTTVFRGHSNAVLSASFGPDGTSVITASADRTARLWNAKSGQQITIFAGHTGAVNTANISSDGKRVVTASRDQSARVWDTLSGNQTRAFAQRDWVQGAWFIVDGARVITASADGAAHLWNTDSGQENTRLLGHTREITSVAQDSQGKRIATASSDGSVAVWDINFEDESVTLNGHFKPVWSAFYNSDGRRLVTASDDATAKLWDGESGKELATLSGHTDRLTGAYISKDGNRIATVSMDGTAGLWRSDGTKFVPLMGHSSKIWSGSFSPDSTRFVTTSADRTARLWNSRDGGLIAILEGHVDQVVSAAFACDGKRLMTTSIDATARVWDGETGRQIAILAGHTRAVASGSISCNGKRVATASDDATARIWDTETGKTISVLSGHTSRINSIVHSQNGTRILTSSDDGTARVWDGESGDGIAVLRGHTSAVWSATFGPDGHRIVTASADKTVRLWDGETGDNLAVMVGHKLDAVGANFSPNGRQLATASLDGTVRLWRIEPWISVSEVVKSAIDQVPRCLSPEERHDNFLGEPPDWCFAMAKPPYKPRRFGFSYSRIDPSRAKALRLDQADGLVVQRVVRGSPADRAGLKRNDIIRLANDERIIDVDDFRATLDRIGPTESIYLLVERRGENHNLSLRPSF